MRRETVVGWVVVAFTALTLFTTVIPTVYTLDSAEFSTGAYTLGFVHAPGYPLYLLLLNGFLRLTPAMMEVGYRANLFSALCLVATVGLVYAYLLRLTGNTWIAAGTALTFGWSYYVWLVGLFAEVYAPQMLGVALVAWALLGLLAAPTARTALLTGVCVGVAVALHPANALFGLGVALAYVGRRVRWSWTLAAGALAVALFAATLLYFPLRYSADPPLNIAGHYDGDGVFYPVDLGTWDGVVWMVSGRQFEGLFFAESVGDGLLFMAQIVVENYLLFGVMVGMYGLLAWFGENWRGVVVWAVCLLPFVLFYSTYGAVDKRVMFGPVLLLWTFPLALGWRALLDPAYPRWVYGFLATGVLAVLVVNYPRLDLSNERTDRVRAEAVMATAPADTVIFGWWADIVMLEYLHIVEDQRPDLSIYNLFMFPPGNASVYMRQLVEQDRTVWIIGFQEVPDPGADIDMEIIRLDNLPPDVPLYTIFSLSRR